MTLIDLGDFRLRFDPKEVRISIDGEMIDVGAKREEDPTVYSKKEALKIIKQYSPKKGKKSGQKSPE